MSRSLTFRFATFSILVLLSCILAAFAYEKLATELVFLKADKISPHQHYGRTPVLAEILNQRTLLNTVIEQRPEEPRYLLSRAINEEIGTSLQLATTQDFSGYLAAGEYYKRVIKLQLSSPDAWVGYAFTQSLIGTATEKHISNALEFGSWETHLQLRICEAAYRTWPHLSYTSKRLVRFYVAELFARNPVLGRRIVSAMRRAGLISEIEITIPEGR